MLDYQRLIDCVVSELRERSIATSLVRGSALTQIERSQISDLELPFPPQIVEMYESLGNGFRLVWMDGDLAGGCDFPPIATLISSYHSNRDRGKRAWEKLKAVLPFMPPEKRKLFEGATEYPYPFVADAELARKTERQMAGWIPIAKCGNGDKIAIDCNDGTFPVVFDQHDWMDGGSGANGFLMAPDLDHFMGVRRFPGA